MEKDKILDKENPTELDKITCFVYEGISRLHNKNIDVEDMKEIKSTVSKVWRKYFPLDSFLP